MRPLEEVEADIRRGGAFMLVDISSGRLRFYGPNKSFIQRQIDALKQDGRTKEMVNFLIARTRAKGETT